jgi:BirA family transcriptional regulator, biotin operon repressor / biotin---[acetyl-CoA-carboxylase] ligase
MTHDISFNLARLRAELKPFRLYWFPRLRSTSDHAAFLRREGRLYAPAVVLTGRQIAGRGRGSNTWWSGGGAMTVTFAVPMRDRLPPQELPLIAGLAVRAACVELSGERDIQLKWPNDVLHDGQKLAGLLCERVSNVDLIGIGLNVNVDPAHAPKALQRRITSLLCIAGKPFDMTEVLIILAEKIHREVRRRLELPFSDFVREYSHHDALAGKTVTITGGSNEPAIVGRCEGVDSSGRLLVRQRGKLHTIIAGGVEMGSGA